MAIPQPINDLSNLTISNYRRIWKPFMVKYDCQKICELGVFEGTNFDLMIDHEPQLAVAIDAWIDDRVRARNDMGLTQKQLNDQYQIFASRMASKPYVKIYREYTLEAVNHFPNNFFDLIYLDADHTYEGCLKDIESWYPKVKVNGFMVGDDYRKGFTANTKVKLGVKEAVTFFAKTNNLTAYELPNHGWAIIKTND